MLNGRYRLIRVIGTGGFGRVWEAHDQDLDRAVAVKEVTLSFLSPEQQQERLSRALREGRHAAALADHPNIVSVYDVVIEDNKPWIVMQLVRGSSLRHLLQSDPDDPASTKTPLDLATVTKIADAMLAALGALHAAKILHRDIKPGNILLADDGRVLLTDFGIAKTETDTTLTFAGSVMGTMAYIAPERAEGTTDDPRSDLFSLGVTLFEAVEGKSPFDRNSKTGTLTAILTKPLPPMANAGKLAPLIEALTLKLPEQRPTIAQAQALLKGDGNRDLKPQAQDDMATEAPQPQMNEGHSGQPTSGKKPKLPWDSVTLTGSAGLPRPPVISIPHSQARKAGTTRARIWQTITAAIAVVVLAVVGLVLWSGHHGDQRVNSPALNLPKLSTLPLTPADTPTDVSASTPSATGRPTPATVAISAPSSAADTADVASHPSTTPATIATPAPPPTTNHTTSAARVDTGHAVVSQLKAPNFDGYCRATDQGGAVLNPSLKGYGWRCIDDNGTGDDAEAVCQWTNNTTQVTNRIADFNDPNSWQCWSATRELGAIAWDTYCQDKGWGHAVDAGKNNVYTWYCSGTSNGLDSQDACLILYGSSPPVSRFQNFYDKNTWQCWG